MQIAGHRCIETKEGTYLLRDVIDEDGRRIRSEYATGTPPNYEWHPCTTGELDLTEIEPIFRAGQMVKSRPWPRANEASMR